MEALLKRHGYKKECSPTGKCGKPRKSRQMPNPELKYVQIKKNQESWKVTGIEKQIIYGKKEDINESIISMSHIERQNLTLRQDNNRLTRKTL